MIEFLIFVAVAVSLPALLLGILQLVAPQSPLHQGMLRRLTRFRLWHLMGLVITCALLFAMAVSNSPGFPFFLLVLMIAGLFLRVWRDEFVFLMGREDADFPGRHDKLVWAVVLLLFAPAGVWFFRAYRLAQWPEPEDRLQPETNSPGTTIPKPNLY